MCEGHRDDEQGGEQEAADNFPCRRSSPAAHGRARGGMSGIGSTWRGGDRPAAASVTALGHARRRRVEARLGAPPRGRDIDVAAVASLGAASPPPAPAAIPPRRRAARGASPRRPLALSGLERDRLLDRERERGRHLGRDLVEADRVLACCSGPARSTTWPRRAAARRAAGRSRRRARTGLPAGRPRCRWPARASYAAVPAPSRPG